MCFVCTAVSCEMLHFYIDFLHTQSSKALCRAYNCLIMHVAVWPAILPAHPPARLLTSLHTYPPTNPPIYLVTSLHTFPPTHLLTSLHPYPPSHPPIYLHTSLHTHPHTHLSTYLTPYIPTYPPIYLHTYLPTSFYTIPQQPKKIYFIKEPENSF